MAVNIPQLLYWLAYTVDEPTATAFKNSGAISPADAASVEATVGSPVVGPLLEALRASTNVSPTPGALLWRPLCRVETLQELAKVVPPA
jgi:hypothetical protein